MVCKSIVGNKNFQTAEKIRYLLENSYYVGVTCQKNQFKYQTNDYKGLEYPGSLINQTILTIPTLSMRHLSVPNTHSSLEIDSESNKNIPIRELISFISYSIEYSDYISMAT